MSFKIREIEIPNPLVLAPMAGICNEAFRTICKEMGAGLVVSEMLSSNAINYENEKTLKMAKIAQIEHPISIQIFGSDIENLKKAAIFVDTKTDADIIDINMGCPVNKVAKTNAGAALLKDPNKVYAVVKSVVDVVKKPVTVKIRTGWDSNTINAVENAKMIEKAGASAITIHGRTRAQMYEGKADYEIIKKVVESVQIPVIGNGDVTDIESLQEILKTGVKGVAIARGALGNPFIFRELNHYLTTGETLPKPTNEERYNMILNQYEILKQIKSEKTAVMEMRSHIAWYLKGLPNASEVKNKIMKLKDFQEITKILEAYFMI